MSRTWRWLRVGALLVVLAAAAAWLLLRAGLRFEMGGTSTRPVIGFADEELQADELERHRAEQRGAAPAAGGAPPLYAVTGGEAAARTAVANEPAPATASDGVPTSAEAGGAAPGSNAPGSTTPGSAATDGATRNGAATGAAAPQGSDWPTFRGAALDGVVRQRLALEWPREGPPRLFHQPIGGGYASFVAGEGRAYTIEQRRDQEVAAAYDPVSGRELWTNSWSALFSESMGGDGPRATPAYDRGRVFALGAAGELRALRASDGEVLWRRNILEDAGAGNLPWGQAASPIVAGEVVITLPGGNRGGVAAYHVSSGEIAWRALGERAAYTAPMVATVAGERQLVLVMAERALGLRPGAGETLWEFPWRTDHDVNAAQPLVLPGEGPSTTPIFISAGYGHGAAVFEVRREGDRFAVAERWQNKNMKNKFSSSVTDGQSVYGLDEGILACVDLQSGEKRWKGGRYGHGQLLLAGDRLIVLGERGELAWVAATPETFRELGKIQALRGKTWNVPAITSGILLVRNAAEMAGYDLRPR